MFVREGLKERSHFVSRMLLTLQLLGRKMLSSPVIGGPAIISQWVEKLTNHIFPLNVLATNYRDTCGGWD